MVFWTSGIKQGDERRVTSDESHYYTTGVSSLVTCHFFLLLLLRRSHGCQNVRLVAKIFGSHFLDVFKCDGVHGVVQLLITIETQAVKLVERAMITERVIALIGDLLLANQFLFRAL